MSGAGSIGDFVRRLEKLATPKTISDLNRKLGSDAIKLINESIDSGVDPYGTVWPRRTDGQMALQGLRNTFSAIWTGDWIRVSSSKWYAKVHQAGWVIHAVHAKNLRFRLPNGSWVSKPSVKIPQRRLVPVQELGLGSKWTERFMKTTEQFFRDRLQGR